MPFVESAWLVRDEEQPVDALEKRVLESDAPIEIHHAREERLAHLLVFRGGRLGDERIQLGALGGEIDRRSEVIDQRARAAQRHDKRVGVAGENAGGFIYGRLPHVLRHAVPVVDVALDELPVDIYEARSRSILHVPFLDEVARDRKPLRVRKDAGEEDHLAKFAPPAAVGEVRRPVSR